MSRKSHKAQQDKKVRVDQLVINRNKKDSVLPEEEIKFTNENYTGSL